MSEDITYCAYKCKNTKCDRNYKHIKQFNIPHSFAYFDDCKEKMLKGGGDKEW